MKKLTQEKIQKIIEEYKENNSLRIVSRQLKISKSTAWKYINQSGNLKKQNIITKLNSADERLIGLYVGMWMGDGTQYFDINQRGYCVKICSNKENILLNKFILNIINSIFGKKAFLINEKNTNQAYIKFYSKFIFHWVYFYVARDENKTHSVRLKEGVNYYTQEFLEGCLLGLTLSDGYLKQRFYFNVTSERLAENMFDILTKFGFNPRKYTHNRAKYGWKDLHMVNLIVSESARLELLLDKILKKLGCEYSFRELKYEKHWARRDSNTRPLPVRFFPKGKLSE